MSQGLLPFLLHFKILAFREKFLDFKREKELKLAYFNAFQTKKGQFHPIK